MRHLVRIADPLHRDRCADHLALLRQHRVELRLIDHARIDRNNTHASRAIFLRLRLAPYPDSALAFLEPQAVSPRLTANAGIQIASSLVATAEQVQTDTPTPHPSTPPPTR